MKLYYLLIAMSFWITVSTGFAEAASLHEVTKKNLETAMHGEAYASLKYQAYANKAEKDGNLDLARLYRDTAKVEANEHFDREAEMLDLAGSDVSNLVDAMKGEYVEYTKMYVGFAEQAEKDGDAKAAALFRHMASDEGDHYNSYREALDKLKQKN